MTGASVLALCDSRGVTLTLEGNGFRAAGPKSAREELKPLVLEHKAEIVALLRAPDPAPTTGEQVTSSSPTSASSSPHRWARGPFGEQVDLFGLNCFEDPNRDSPYPRGSQCN